MEVRINTAALDKAFATLPRSTRNKALRPALREGAKVVQKAAIANVNDISQEKSTGLLAKSIVVRSYKALREMLRVGVQIKKGAAYFNKKDRNGPVRVALVSAVLEYGKKGQPPRSRIRKAAREQTQAVANVIRQEASKRMADAVQDAKS